MAYSNSQNDRKRPGRVEDAAGLNQMQANLEHLAGTEAGQERIVSEAPIEALSFSSSHASNFDSIKDYTAGETPEILLTSENIDSPSEIADDTTIEIRQEIERADASASQQNGGITFTRVSSQSGRIDIGSVAYATPAAVVTIGPNGYFGVQCGAALPEYPLDVPTGKINVSGDYLRDGSPINDWTVAGGAITWTGNARVYRYWESAVATGTPPLDFASTTEIANLDANYLKGRGWHGGVMVHGSASYGSSQTIIASSTLATSAGAVWEVLASVTVNTDTADVGLDITMDLYNGASVFQTRTGGNTPKVEAVNTSYGGYSGGNTFSRLLLGTFTSATGTETLSVRVGVSGGTGSTAEAVLVLHRVR